MGAHQRHSPPSAEGAKNFFRGDALKQYSKQQQKEFSQE